MEVWIICGDNNPFFFSFIFISWRLITLQYCSVFCVYGGKPKLWESEQTVRVSREPCCT